MIFENQILFKNLFEGLISYNKYLKDNSIHKLLGVNLNHYGDVKIKKKNLITL